jgi:hypothetical protein
MWEKCPGHVRQKATQPLGAIGIAVITIAGYAAMIHFIDRASRFPEMQYPSDHCFVSIY